jgi:hypothetical protein
MAFGARPSNTRTREESDAQVAQALVAALGILRAEPLRISHVRDGQDFLMSGPGVSPFGQGGTGGPGGFSPTGDGGGGASPPGEPGERGEDGEPGQTGEPGQIGPQGPAGPAGPAGAPGPTGPAGSNGSDASVNGYIEYIDSVTYDTSDHCIKTTTKKVYGFFANTGSGSAFGASLGSSNVTCAEECDS